jgi:hypothetical protein
MFQKCKIFPQNPIGNECSSHYKYVFSKYILLGSYFTYRSYKWYNPYFLDPTVRIKMLVVDFPKNLIFHLYRILIEFGKKMMVRYVYLKFKGNFPNSMSPLQTLLMYN